MESKRKGEGVKYEQKEIPGVSDVICSSCTRQESVICSTEQQTLSGRTEQGRAGQGSSLACICLTETFLKVNGWQRMGQETDIIQSDLIKPKTTLLLREKLLPLLCEHFYSSMFDVSDEQDLMTYNK